MINKINICGIPHKVIEVDDVFDANGYHLGQIDYKDATIKIRKDMTEEMKAFTLMHEVVHGILTLIGEDEKSQDERFVQVLAMAIMGTFELKEPYKEVETDD